MVTKLNRGAFLRTAFVLVLSMFALNAYAQGGFGGGGGGGRGGGGGGGARTAQPKTWDLFVLDPKELDLTRDQKRALRDICDQYDDDVKELTGRGNTQLTPEMQVEMAEIRDATNIAIEHALTEEQRSIRQTVMAERATAGRGRGGPGRGGAGGFGGGGGGGGFGGGGGGGGFGGGGGGGGFGGGGGGGPR